MFPILARARLPFVGVPLTPKGGTSIQSVTTTGTINQLIPSASVIVFTPATDLTINGIAAGYDGQEITLINRSGTASVFLANQSASASAPDRMVNWITSGPTPLFIARGRATYRYQASAARWLLTSHNMGGWMPSTFNAAEFTGSGAMTWTVAAGDVPLDAFTIIDRVMFWNFRYLTTSVGGVVSTELRKTPPNGYSVNGNSPVASNVGNDNGTGTMISLVFNTATQLAILKAPGGGNWTPSADLTSVNGMMQFNLL